MSNNSLVPSNNTLELSRQYPASSFNVLVPIQTVTEIADIQKPVMNVVHISTDLNDKEIYLQQKPSNEWTDRNGKKHPAQPALYSLTRKGLLKLMRAAGIRMVSSKSVLPSTCQKCVEANRAIGKPVNCGQCGNKDVKYTVCILAPQLTGQDIMYTASREMNIQEETQGMTDQQRQQFMKFRAEHCESKALNRALRAAMLIKPAYLIEELQKPFVVAYLVPNLNNPEVKARAVDSYFAGAQELYGHTGISQPQVIEVSDDDGDGYGEPPMIPGDISDPTPQDGGYPDDDIPDYLRDEPDDTAPAQPPEPPVPKCAACGCEIVQNGRWTPDAIIEYSTKVYGRPLCPACQKKSQRR